MFLNVLMMLQLTLCCVHSVSVTVFKGICCVFNVLVEFSYVAEVTFTARWACVSEKEKNVMGRDY